MSRLDIKTPSRAQTVVEGLYRDMERRIAASPPGLCPVDMSLSFLQLCHAQTCGKCVPCRIGLGQLTLLINQVLDGEATMETIAIIEKTARSIVNTADCAIGRDAARLVVEGLENYVCIYTESTKLLVRSTMKRMIEALPGGVFQQVHKSYLINLEKIEMIDGNRIIVGRHTVPVARNFREEVFARILKNTL